AGAQWFWLSSTLNPYSDPTYTMVSTGWSALPDQDFVFKTYVAPPVNDQLADLLTAVTGVGPGHSLADKVELIQGFVAANDRASACGLLNAFINEVQAQRGKKLDAGEAGSLIDQASEIKTALAC